MAKKLNQLQNSLRSCKNASKQGYEDAEAILNELQASVDSASASLTSTLEGLRANHLRDNHFVEKVEEQVQTFTEGFRSIYQKAEDDVNEKYNSTKSFTITLFGRTKAGKSTLREILTHGDGSTIGKGGQRTTTDVHRYEWNGMTVIDVPGIEAFNGQADEELALKNAIPADLILFLITSGSPRKKEAEWLCRLKRMDKPIICICNAKQDIGDEEDPEGIRMRRFLRDPLAFLKQIHIDEVLQQFNEFVQDYLPGEHLSILVVHLLSRFLADQPQYADKREELVNASQFPALEKRITDEVIANAILYRKRCYLSLIDAPLFSAMGELFLTSENNYYLYKLLEEKHSAYVAWKTKTWLKKKEVLQGIINDSYHGLELAVPRFIEKHQGEDDFGEKWNRKVKDAKVNTKLNEKLKTLFKDYAQQIEDFFKDFQTEAGSVDSNGLRTPSISSNVGFDWKTTLHLSGGGLIATGSLIWALGWSNPVGWALLGVGAVLEVSGFFSKSREKKMQKERERLSGILYDWLNKTKDLQFQELEKWYSKNLSMGLIREATNRFKSTEQYLLGLANSQRSLACNLAERHCIVSRRMIDNILEDLQLDYLKDTIAQVARIPGHRTLILTTTEEQLPLGDISRKLGSKEQIDAVRIRILSHSEERCQALFKYYFKARVQPLLKTVDDLQTIAYVPKEKYSDDDIRKMQLIQQATRIHIIISYEGNQD